MKIYNLPARNKTIQNEVLSSRYPLLAIKLSHVDELLVLEQNIIANGAIFSKQDKIYMKLKKSVYYAIDDYCGAEVFYKGLLSTGIDAELFLDQLILLHERKRKLAVELSTYKNKNIRSINKALIAIKPIESKYLVLDQHVSDRVIVKCQETVIVKPDIIEDKQKPLTLDERVARLEKLAAEKAHRTANESHEERMNRLKEDAVKAEQKRSQEKHDNDEKRKDRKANQEYTHANNEDKRKESSSKAKENKTDYEYFITAGGFIYTLLPPQLKVPFIVAGGVLMAGNYVYKNYYAKTA